MSQIAYIQPYQSDEFYRLVALVLNELQSRSLGYDEGGAVTQALAKTATVTLDKLSGQITMHNASLAANTSVSFVLLNNQIGENDNIPVSVAYGATADTYLVGVDAIANGQCRIHLRNVSGAARAESIKIVFTVLKGAVA